MKSEMWNLVRSRIAEEMDSSQMKAWFGDVEAEETDSTLILKAPTIFHKEWIEDHFVDKMGGILRSKTGNDDFKIRLVIKGEPPREKQGISGRISKTVRAGGGKRRITSRSRTVRRRTRQEDVEDLWEASVSTSSMLNPEYSFDSFIVGPSNQFAYAAAQTVARDPANLYNPFFIYGGTGLGKTHLLQAIGHLVLSSDPGATVIYVSAEQFTNEFINSLRDKKMDAFHRKYRNIDLLLVDDIQFLANRERSQEEFFHTFNELHESKRQLVISSDRPPREIPMVEERLSSRLEWGLSADIKPPDLETRIAILRKKVEKIGAHVPDDCIQYLASRFRSNIRELEGALTRVVATASLTGQVISMDLTRDAIKDLVSGRFDGMVTISHIQRTVAEYFSISVADLKGKRRTSNIAFPRQIAMFISRDMTESSLPVIGGEFGNRDHTTVLYSCNKIQNLLERDRRVRNMVEDIRRNLS